MKPNKKSENLRNIDSVGHLRGESIYVDDIAIREGTLYGAVFGSPVAHGNIKKIDISKALKMNGVHSVITHKDIISNNQVGGIIQDQPLLAEDKVMHVGQAIAMILADTEENARLALCGIEMEIEELPIITCPREAQQKGELLVPSRTFSLGDTDFAYKACDYVIEGTAEINGQEHLYLETNGSYAWPTENGDMKICSSSQAPAHIQEAVHKVTGLPIHKIEVEVNRVGGAFGGKEVQGDFWAAMVGIACHKYKRPVKLVLHRHDDMIMTGKRHPYEFNYKIGFDKDFKIRSYEVECFQNGGAFADISPAIMERTLFHGTASYNIPNAKITVHSCRTHLPPNTAFRGFGAPQGMFVIESALYKASRLHNVNYEEIQYKNLIKDGDIFPYGQIAERSNAQSCFDDLKETYDLDKMHREADEFNKNSTTSKKGVAVYPLCFGISFTKTGLNQGMSLVHIYADGSVSISTGVIEMGQGVNTKIIQVAASTFSIDPSRIKIHATNTTRIANAAPTAASSGADLNGAATEVACRNILKRIKGHAAKLLGTQAEKVIIKDEIIYVDNCPSELTWNALITDCIWNRVCVSEHGHYSSPGIYFDKEREKGRAFTYHVYGTAAASVTVDCLRGTYDIDSVKIVHDFGTSINPHLDFGQVEGALLQGIGLVTNEELVYNEKGKLISDSLSSYKVPDIQFAPEDIEIKALDTAPAENAIFGSKAVGEPPLMYGFSVYFALQNAIRAFNSNGELKCKSPMTHKRCLEALYDGLKF
ncbi:MAG: molybdopterin-dependent oxidoreductase [Bacteriovoracaceae bacterium]|nr:molybdopterin-dependent oxidoreductase [Bacteriovoracaceae bacterium]